MRRSLLAAIAAAVFLGAPAVTLAHEGGIDARGVVTAISDDGLTISTRQGEESFSLTPRTRFVAGKRPLARAEVRVGDRVVVHAKRGGGRPEAVEVRGAAREVRPGR